MSKKAKNILVSLNLRVLVDSEDDNESILSGKLLKEVLINTIENNNFAATIQDDLTNPFNMDDAINIAMQELKNDVTTPHAIGSVGIIIKNRVRELLQDNFNEDEFTSKWFD